MAEIVNISTAEDLIDFSNRDEKSRGSSTDYLEVVFTKDIDFNDLPDTGDYAQYKFQWAGCQGTWYMNVDGQGHSVKNISFDSSEKNWSFFGTVYGTVSNLTLSDVNVTGVNVRGLVYLLRNGYSISNCHVRGQLTGTFVTGIAGGAGNSSSSVTIDRCSVGGTLTGVIDVFGICHSVGLSSVYKLSTVQNSYINATIKAGTRLNCLIGNCIGLNTFFIGNYTPNGRCQFSYGSNADKYCYVVFTNASELTNFTCTTLFNASAIQCWYDNTIWKNGDENRGTPDLQNADEMRKKGWAI